MSIEQWTWEDFGPGKTGPQFFDLLDRLRIWGCGLDSATKTIKDCVQKFQLEVMKLKGTYPGGPADGWVGPKTLAWLKTDPVVPPKYSISTKPWKWTSPVWNQDRTSPLEVYPIAADFSMSPWFVRRPDGAIVLRANVGGAHTQNSLKARSEFREMNPDGTKAKWDSEDGNLHVIEETLSIVALPPVVPSAVFGQYHDPIDDVFMLSITGNEDRRYGTIHLLESLGFGNGSTKHLLDSSYKLGEPLSYRTEMGNGGFKCIYKDVVKEIEGEWEDVYRKAGIYLQTDTSKGESPNSYGELIIFKLSIFDI